MIKRWCNSFIQNCQKWQAYVCNDCSIDHSDTIFSNGFRLIEKQFALNEAKYFFWNGIFDMQSDLSPKTVEDKTINTVTNKQWMPCFKSVTDVFAFSSLKVYRCISINFFLSTLSSVSLVPSTITSSLKRTQWFVAVYVFLHESYLKFCGYWTLFW